RRSPVSNVIWLIGARKPAHMTDHMTGLKSPGSPTPNSPQGGPHRRGTIQAALAKEGLRYQRGGHIMGRALTGPSRSLGDRLKEEGRQALELEYQRAYDQVEADPPTAVTAACAILETVCKTYLEDEGHPFPSKQVLGPLWTETASRLGLAAKDVADGDLRQILSGLSSIAVGVAALRTHKGSAHGHSDAATRNYRLEPRHARLAVHAAHTLAMFVLETWEARKSNRP
ncbi:abortive infection family protein, partial [Rhodoferax sp.]|uniref:abortive infection family protein n=2 Tax=Pseudomonadota TaxID=1224 RepID=UPI00274F3D53|nr:abortive infection family protein [Rhodoferax sp.]